MSEWSDRARRPRRPGQVLCWCGNAQAHPLGARSTCTTEAVPFPRPVVHITVTTGQPLDGLMCGAEPDRRLHFTSLGRMRSRAWDPDKRWTPCAACLENANLDENGDDLEEADAA